MSRHSTNRERPVATVMFAMTDKERAALHDHPVKCLRWIQTEPVFEPEWFRTLALRLYYVYLGARNFHEEKQIRIRALLGINSLRQLVDIRQINPQAKLSDAEHDIIEQCLEFSKEYDEAILRSWIRRHYEQAQVLLRRDARLQPVLA